MSIAALAFTVQFTRFNVFLCVVPGTTAIGHHQRQQYPGQSGPGEHAAKSFDTDHETNQNRRRNSHNTGQYHFPQSGTSRDIDAFLRFGLNPGLAFQQPRNFAELTTNLINHLPRSTTDRSHGHGTDQEGQHAADEQADHHLGFDQVDACQANGSGVGGEQSQSRQSRRADGKTLADGGGGVADGIQTVSNLTNIGAQSAHLGDAACVVGNGAVGVNGHGDADSSQHANSGDTDTVQTSEVVSDKDAHADDQDRQSTTLKTDRQTVNNIGSRASLAGFGNTCHGRRGSVILSDLADGDACQGTGQNSVKHTDIDAKALNHKVGSNQKASSSHKGGVV